MQTQKGKKGTFPHWPLDDFSAISWYFAQELSDLVWSLNGQNQTDPPVLHLLLFLLPLLLCPCCSC